MYYRRCSCIGWSMAAFGAGLLISCCLHYSLILVLVAILFIVLGLAMR